MIEKMSFDAQDYALVDLVQSFRLARQNGMGIAEFNTVLHPHGIIELTSSHSMRIAYALIILLESLDADDGEKRLFALRRLYDEVMNCGNSSLRHNSGRVLIELMKDIVRSPFDAHALYLAHDFHAAARGNPRIVRALLQRYNLLEMSEDWNQQAFDHHVHDANTKGRKTPTHLVMDAWIKGIRFVTVLYYNRVVDDAVSELLQAAHIMGITVRVGIEFRAAYRGRFVHIIWSPLGSSDQEQLATVLQQKAVQDILGDYVPATAWLGEHSLALLQEWNAKHRHAMATELGIATPRALSEEEFLNFVGQRIPMALHLAEYVRKTILVDLDSNLVDKDGSLVDKDGSLVNKDAHTEQNALHLEEERATIEALMPNEILQRWLSRVANPHIIFPRVPHPSMPDVLLRSPEALIEKLALIPSSQIILQLTHLTEADVLELLWKSKGKITHLELFNLKDWADGHMGHIKEINELQYVINEGSAPELKHLVQEIIANYTHEDPQNIAHDDERKACFAEVQRNISTLQKMYAHTPLGSRLGTDSASHAYRTYGMGLAFLETLPRRARDIALRQESGRLVLPIFTDIHKFTRVHVSFDETRHKKAFWSVKKKVTGWGLEKRTTRVLDKGNLITLGGMEQGDGRPQPCLPSDSVPHGQTVPPKQPVQKEVGQRVSCACPKPSWRKQAAYLNSNVVNALKVILGFIPAQCAFMYTDAWWFLVYFGALIWFFITGGRNIIQGIVSAGAVRKRLMVSWRRCIDWGRVADSLLYTGFSVLLLEVVVRAWLLQDMLGITASDNALAVYCVMAVANGAYISSHNIFRGFPKEAVVGNFFRSVLAVPVAFLFGEILLIAMQSMGTENPALIVQTCAAVTSKCASDTVAAVIEGFADKNKYIALRRWDYQTKFKQIYENFSSQELLFAKKKILDYRKTPHELWNMLMAKNPQLAHEAVLNALDMLYFWHYLPRARQVLREEFRRMSATEKEIIYATHSFLTLEREVCTLILKGVFGKKYAPILSFYLVTRDSYLAELKKCMK